MSSAGRCVKVVEMEVKRMECKYTATWNVVSNVHKMYSMVMCLGKNQTHSGQKAYLFQPKPTNHSPNERSAAAHRSRTCVLRVTPLYTASNPHSHRARLRATVSPTASRSRVILLAEVLHLLVRRVGHARHGEGGESRENRAGREERLAMPDIVTGNAREARGRRHTNGCVNGRLRVLSSWAGSWVLRGGALRAVLVGAQPREVDLGRAHGALVGALAPL